MSFWTLPLTRKKTGKHILLYCTVSAQSYTGKKENKIFLMFKEIQMGSGDKSYKRKGFLIYDEMHKYFYHICEEVVNHVHDFAPDP